MAKILFISVNDVNAEGIRIMSSVLKNRGHQSYILFIKRHANVALKVKNIKEEDWIGISVQGKYFRHARGPEITNHEENLIIRVIGEINPDLIGISVNAPLKSRSIAITKLIKNEFSIPIIWGGAFPTVNPEFCLNYCDFVCIGEGERAIGEIADRIHNHRDIQEIKNIGYIADGEYIQNDLDMLIGNLDELPFKDISPQNKFLIEGNRLMVRFAETSYSKNFKYHTIGSRGCPYNCSYCCENYFKRLYSPQPFMRRRSPYHLIQELKEAKERIKYKVVQFEDEIFSLDCRWLEEFSMLYRKEIDVPFICYIYPNTEIEKQLELLKETGLILTCLGLQSGSERINKEIFHRPFDKGLFYSTAERLNSLNIDYYVDVITYNPFEREEDLEATSRMLLDLPKPYGLCVNKLYVIEGTEIARMTANIDKINKKQPLPGKVFHFYSRLFWLSAFTGLYKRVILAVHEGQILNKVFQRINPFLLNVPFYFFYLFRKFRQRHKFFF